MDINQYSLYTMGANQEEKENLARVMNLIEEFKNINTAKDAKDYLKAHFDIKDLVQNYPLGCNSFMSIKETSKICYVSVECNNENYIYCYRK